MGGDELTAFLSYLASQRNVSASTQNQALSAILFLYRDVLKIKLPWLSDVQRAKKPRRLPVVLTRQEVRAVLAQLEGKTWLMAALIYGAGLRLLECLRLRVKDIDFGHQQLMIRDAKGQKDRITLLPQNLVDPLRSHLARVRTLHERDLRDKFGRVYLPFALASKYPNADREWQWQYSFPSSRRSLEFYDAREESLSRGVIALIHLGKRGKGKVVGRAGLEPATKGLCVPLRLSPPVSGSWSGLCLAFRPSRRVSTRSASNASALRGASLGVGKAPHVEKMGCRKRSPNLRSSTPRQSELALGNPRGVCRASRDHGGV